MTDVQDEVTSVLARNTATECGRRWRSGSRVRGSQASETLKTLQAGRGLAALAVAAFHLSVTLGQSRYGGIDVFGAVTRFGYLGLDFFFVLSGFIILYAHANDIGRPERLGFYAKRRFIRIYPIYWLYTLLFVLIVLAGVHSHTALPAGLVDWITSITLVRFSDVQTPLSVAWTLFPEIAFYVLFSVLILSRPAGWLLFVLWGAIGLAFFEEKHVPLSPLIYVSGYNLNFIFGMAAYYLYRSSRLEVGAGPSALMLMLFALVAGYAALAHSSLLFAAGSALFIAALATVERRYHIYVPAVFVLLGDASYSIYLLHPPLEGVIGRIVSQPGIRALIGDIGAYSVVLVSAVGLSYLAFKLLEVPLLRTLGGKPLRQAWWRND